MTGVSGGDNGIDSADGARNEVVMEGQMVVIVNGGGWCAMRKGVFFVHFKC